jgi:hypothetical protein
MTNLSDLLTPSGVAEVNNPSFTGDMTITGTVDGVDIAEAIPATFGSASGQMLMVDSDGTATIWSATRIAQVRNVSTIADVNVNSTFTDVVISGITDFMDQGFSAGSTGIVCGFTGRVKVTLHMYMYSTNGRISPQIVTAVNGTPTTIIGGTGYIRALDAHNNASCTVVSYLSVTPGDEVTLQSRQGSSISGAVTAPAGSSMILIERI